MPQRRHRHSQQEDTIHALSSEITASLVYDKCNSSKDGRPTVPWFCVSCCSLKAWRHGPHAKQLFATSARGTTSDVASWGQPSTPHGPSKIGQSSSQPTSQSPHRRNKGASSGSLNTCIHCQAPTQPTVPGMFFVAMPSASKVATSVLACGCMLKNVHIFRCDSISCHLTNSPIENTRDTLRKLQLGS